MKRVEFQMNIYQFKFFWQREEQLWTLNCFNSASENFPNQVFVTRSHTCEDQTEAHGPVWLLHGPKMSTTAQKASNSSQLTSRILLPLVSCWEEKKTRGCFFFYFFSRNTNTWQRPRERENYWLEKLKLWTLDMFSMFFSPWVTTVQKSTFNLCRTEL